MQWVHCHLTLNISIHALREESDSSTFLSALRIFKFQSTPSARRATLHAGTICAGRFNFNPRPPRGERHP